MSNKYSEDEYNINDRCGLPVPPKSAYCAMAKKHPHAEVKHLCELAREKISEAPQSRPCPRTGEAVCRCGAPYTCETTSANNVTI